MPNSNSVRQPSAVLDENGKKTFRYMKALPVADICLQCHGPVEGLDAGLKAKLAALYPDDHAVGYGKGQIRGALTVKRLLP